MVYCEKYQNASNVHAEGESRAHMEVERLTRLLDQQRLETANAIKQKLEWKQKCAEVTSRTDEHEQPSTSIRCVLRLNCVL